MKRIDRKNIGYGLYGIPEPVFFSLVHHLHYVRNCYAHHSRLWDRTWKVRAALPQHSDESLVGTKYRKSERQWEIDDAPKSEKFLASGELCFWLLDQKSR